MFESVKRKIIGKALNLDEGQLRAQAEQMQIEVVRRLGEDFAHKYTPDEITHLAQRFFYHQAMITQELMKDPEALPPVTP